MSKKYMRIYCNGEKIRSTGSSIEDIHRVLNEFGCYDFNQILGAFQNANGFTTMNIKQQNYQTALGFLINVFKLTSEFLRYTSNSVYSTLFKKAV